MTALKHLQQLKKTVPHLYQATASQLEATEVCLQQTLNSVNPLLNEAAAYLFSGGGKRLRPALLLLCTKAVQQRECNPIPAAAAVEIMHMASLVHDDIVDNAPLRRGKATVHKKWNRETALYTGNFMICQGLELASSYENRKISAIALHTAAAMCKGEFAQQEAAYTDEYRESDYYNRIGGKTAMLLAAACEIGAYIGGAAEPTAAVCRSYGYDLGMAFQITDDILDYTAAEQDSFGKSRGTDLKEGNITLPLIYALKNGFSPNLLKEFFRDGGKNKELREEIIAGVTRCGGTEEAQKAALRYLEKAKAEIAALPHNSYTEAFTETADYILKRQI